MALIFQRLFFKDSKPPPRARVLVTKLRSGGVFGRLYGVAKFGARSLPVRSGPRARAYLSKNPLSLGIKPITLLPNPLRFQVVAELTCQRSSPAESSRPMGRQITVAGMIDAGYTGLRVCCRAGSSWHRCPHTRVLPLAELPTWAGPMPIDDLPFACTACGNLTRENPERDLMLVGPDPGGWLAWVNWDTAGPPQDPAIEAALRRGRYP